MSANHPDKASSEQQTYSSDQQTIAYSSIAKSMHWVVAGLILLQYLLIELAEIAEHKGLIVKQLATIANHKSVGISILVFALFRLIYRLRNPAPALPNTMPRWQHRASHLSHFLLYFCLFAMPLTGWLMSSANAYSVSWFNIVPLPDLVSADKSLAQWLGDVHSWLADGLIILAALHIAAAFKHHLFDKDTVLSRMCSKASVGFGVFVLVLGLLSMGSGSWGKLDLILGSDSPPTQQSKDTDTNQSIDDSITTQAIKPSSLPVWNIDYSNSQIQFSGEQAGAPFTGSWNKWQASLQFDSADLQQSRFDVNIQIESVNSNDEERDQTILSSDFFDSIKFPIARFQASSFSSQGNEFIAKGTLTIKDITRPCTLVFKVTQTDKGKELTGQASLNRHDWDVGIGDWADPTWVGSEVIVNVRVVANN